MDAKLKERAQAVAALTYNERRKAGALPEIKEVHYLLYGSDVACTWCNVDELVRRISQKLIQEPLIIKNMANPKGHFKSGAASTEIIRHGKNGTTVITPDNLNTGDNFEFAAKNFPHLVEESKASKAAAAEEEATDENLTPKQKLQAEYKELFGEAPEDAVTVSELKNLIANKQSSDSK